MRLRAFLPGSIVLAMIGAMLLVLPRTSPVAIAADTTTGAAGSGPAAKTAFQTYALALRQAGVERTDIALHVFGLIPGVSRLLPPTASDVEQDVILGAIWGPFFENAIVEVGNVKTPAPIAIYYNPLLDVALWTQWERSNDLSYRITRLRAAPGERLTVSDVEVPATPRWMTEVAPVEALSEITIERLSSHLFDSSFLDSGNLEDVAYDQAAQELRAAQLRLEWNMLQRSQWSVAYAQWLSKTISVIEETMELKDAAALVSRAPDTDPETSMIIADLPDGFVSDLVLDMVLEYDEEYRILIISMQSDGEIYVLIHCRLDLDAKVCMPRQYVLAKVR